VIAALFSLALVFILSRVLNLPTLQWLLERALILLPIAFLILFQPELRRTLEHLGGHALQLPAVSATTSGAEPKRHLEPFVTACEELSRSRTGAIIVFERSNDLSYLARRGTSLNAEPTRDLLLSIFQSASPLHDGAVIVKDARLVAARVTLPLSQREDLAFSLGTRHRAAVGVSEVSDAAAVVISEETGSISLALAGHLYGNLSPSALSSRLGTLL
jgi:diadenylate cyclase